MFWWERCWLNSVSGEDIFASPTCPSSPLAFLWLLICLFMLTAYRFLPSISHVTVYSTLQTRAATVTIFFSVGTVNDIERHRSLTSSLMVDLENSLNCFFFFFISKEQWGHVLSEVYSLWRSTTSNLERRSRRWRLLALSHWDAANWQWLNQTERRRLDCDLCAICSPSPRKLSPKIQFIIHVMERT